MKNYFPIYVYGTIIILEGVFLLFSKYYSFQVMNLTIGITLALGAVFAFIAAYSRKRKQVQFAYHELHALAMLVYGVSILLFCNTMQVLVSFTAFLFIFYSFSEIIFSSWLFNMGEKLLFKIVLIRVLLGFTIGIGTVVAMYFSQYTLVGFGILFILVGINSMLYVPVMKENEPNNLAVSS